VSCSCVLGAVACRLVLLSCNSSCSSLLDCHTCQSIRKKLTVFNFCTCPSILVKCCVGGSHSLGDCDILSIMYFPIMCGFSGVAYLKILVPEFLSIKEGIAGKHLIWWGRVSSITRCCRRCKLCICIVQQLTYILFLQPHNVSRSCFWWVKNEGFVKCVFLLHFCCRRA